MTDIPKTETHIIETKHGPVKITQPAGTRHHGIKVVLDTDDVVREQATGFANFIRDYAVVGLAVGFVVGQQANAVMKQMVTSFVDPLSRMWFGQKLSSRTLTIHHEGQPIAMPWGAFVYILLEFFIVVIVIYALVKLFKLDRLKKPPESNAKK
jgi:large conductance mechanosensitive channel